MDDWETQKRLCFNGAVPNVQVVLRRIFEGNLWCKAGAKGLAQLWAAA